MAMDRDLKEGEEKESGAVGKRKEQRREDEMRTALNVPSSDTQM